MSDAKNGMSCAMGCWALAAGVGLLTVILLLVLGDHRFIAALFLGGVAFAVIGGLSSWIFCRELPGPVTGPNAEGATKLTGAPDTTAKPAAAAPSPSSSAAPASKASDAKPAVATASASTDAEAGAAVKPSKALPGEQDLDARKGSWKYESGAKPAAAAAAEGPGTKPKTYDAPPATGADDLKKIKGVGPKLEKVCNNLGFYTFDQIANWTADEVAWVDQNLEGFKGRVSRDEWVSQAKQLSSGQEREFSKRVDKGGVYD